MRVNPFADILAFLTAPSYHEPFFMVVIFWLVALGSLVVAFRAYQTVPGQKSPRHLARWFARFVVGAMWWQQAQWKFPTDIGGLRYWTEQIIEHAAFPIQGQFFEAVVLPYFSPFAYLVYVIEMTVAVSLLLGLFVRAGGIVGGLFILNLWFGLYRSPEEWPWTYVFLVLLMFLFVVERYGRSLGADALLSADDDKRARRSRVAAFT